MRREWRIEGLSASVEAYREIMLSIRLWLDLSSGILLPTIFLRGSLLDVGEHVRVRGAWMSREGEGMLSYRFISSTGETTGTT